MSTYLSPLLHSGMTTWAGTATVFADMAVGRTYPVNLGEYELIPHQAKGVSDHLSHPLLEF